MIDYKSDLCKLVYPDKEVPPEWEEDKVQVVREFNYFNEEMKPLILLFANEEVKEQVQKSRDSKQLVDFLVSRFGFKLETIDILYKFAKLNYEAGNYTLAAEYLYLHKVLAPLH